MKFVRTGVSIAALLAASSAAADVSIMYNGGFASLIEGGIAAYEEATGEKVDAIKLPGEGYAERIALDLAAGTAADVVMVDSFVVSELASANYLRPLDGLADSWDQYQYYMPGLLDVVSYAGQVFALPTDTDVRMLWYSNALFDQAGIDRPWQPKTWADVLAAGEKIKDLTDAETPIFIPAGTKLGEGTTMQGFYMLLLGADTPEGDRNRLRNRAEGKWIGDSPALRRTLALYDELFNKRGLSSGDFHYSTDPGAAFREGLKSADLGIGANGSWEYACIWDCSGKNLPSIEERNAVVSWVAFPGSGEPGAPETTNISGGWTVAVNAATDEDEASLALLTAIFDRDNFEDWTVTNRRMGVRTDITEGEGYSSDPYLAAASALASKTTGRDTYPGYNIVSALVQQMTADIIDGRSVDDTIEEYHNALIDEFGEDNVMVYQ